MQSAAPADVGPELPNIAATRHNSAEVTATATWRTVPREAGPSFYKGLDKATPKTRLTAAGDSKCGSSGPDTASTPMCLHATSPTWIDPVICRAGLPAWDITCAGDHPSTRSRQLFECSSHLVLILEGLGTRTCSCRWLAITNCTNQACFAAARLKESQCLLQSPGWQVGAATVIPQSLT